MRTIHRARGFTLLELLMLLPFVLAFVGLIVYGLRAELSVYHRLSVQANRQATMRSVLRQLRADIAVAGRVDCGALSSNATLAVAGSPVVGGRFSVPPPASPDPVDWTVDRWSLESSSGTIRYELHEPHVAAFVRETTTQRRIPLPPARLVRIGADGDRREWALHGLEVDGRTGADGAVLRIRFVSTVSSTIGREVRSVFETSLAVGSRS
jgi:hypothetical protein